MLSRLLTRSYHNNYYRALEIGNMAQTLRESNKIIAIIPENNETHAFVDWWCEQNPGFPAEELWPEKMPELEYANVPPLCKYIRFMQNETELIDYLNTPNNGYNPSIPDVYIAIVFDEYPSYGRGCGILNAYDLRRSQELDLHTSSQSDGCSQHVLRGLVPAPCFHHA